jgi:VCBS repeat-containing protein
MPSLSIKSAAWNILNNTSEFDVGSEIGPFIDLPLTLPADGVSPPVDTPSLHYYLRLSLYDGSTVTIDGNQLFALDSSSFDADQAVNIGSQSSGAGAGKVAFNPLELSLEQPALDPLLFKMLASGEPFKQVDVLGYHQGASESDLAVDYSFGLVAASSLKIDDTGVSQLELQYGALEIQHRAQQPDGSFAPDTSAAWNGVQNISGFGGSSEIGPLIDAPTTLPVDGVSPPVNTSSLHYYLRLSLYNGSTVTIDGNQLFAVGGFSFDAEQAVSIGSQSTGAGAGKVAFNPLELSLEQPALDPLLLQMLASGTPFKQVDVLGYHHGASESDLAVDYSFGLVAASSLNIDVTGVTQLELQYGALEIQQFAQLPDGSFAPDTAQGWNRVQNISGFGGSGIGPLLDAPTTLPVDGVSPPIHTSSLHYYLRLSLYNGNTVTIDGNQLFAVDSFSFDAEQAVNIGSQSSGAGAGKVAFNPLQLGLEQPALDPLLFQMLASGEPFKQVDVLGYHQGGSESDLSIDYSFGLVAASSLNIGPNGALLNLEYGALEIQHFAQQPDGSVSPDTAEGWNRVENISGFGGSGIGPLIDVPTSLPVDGISPAIDTSSLHYYLRLTLYNGGTVTVDGNQLFALVGFSFDADLPVNIGSQSSGAGAGKVAFDALQLGIEQPALDPLLFKMLAAGTAFKQVDVLGYHQGVSESDLSVDYSFGLVAASSLGIDASGITQLSLQYGALEIQHFAQQPDGSIAPDTAEGWNGIKNISGFGGSSGIGPLLDAPTTLPVDGVSPPFESSPLHYYLRMTLYNDSTVTIDGNQLFALDSFSFDAEQDVSIGSQSSGAGAGKVTFNPLHLSLEQPALDPMLFHMLASGTPFKQVDVLGYHQGASESDLSVDYSFGLVGVSSLEIDSSGVTKLELQYGAAELQHFAQQPGGSFSLDAAEGWNGIENISGFGGSSGIGPLIDVPTTLPVGGVSPTVDGSSLHYYVRLSLYNGNTVTVDGNQLFALDSFSFSTQQTLNIGSLSSGAGAGAGTVMFSPLQLALEQPALDPLLFQMLASGEPFKQVDVLGYHQGASESHLAVDYSFGLVAASSLNIDPSGITLLGLQYGAVEFQFLNQLPLGVNDAINAHVGGLAIGNVLTNDSDPDGDSLTVSAVDGDPGNVGIPVAGLYGHLTLDAGGSYSYSADNTAAIAAAATGTHLHDLFNYTADDGLNGTAIATLDITLDRPPVAVGDTNNALAGGSAVSGNVLTNDSDPDGDTLTVSAVDGISGEVGVSLPGTYGHLTLNLDGSYSYSADNAAAIAAAGKGSHLHDLFNYTADDGFSGTAVGTLDITLDRPPVATNDLAGIQSGATITGNVLANDQDPDGDAVHVIGLVGGSLAQGLTGKYGTLVLADNGSYSYAASKSAPLPAQGVAQDAFTYIESDGHGGVVQATLDITIIPSGVNYIAGTQGATISSGNGKGIVDASLGDQTIKAGNGADTLIGGPNDVLTGGNGPDVFVFGPTSGHNTITDFDVNNDKIQFDQKLFGSFADIHVKQDGLDAVITYHGSDTLTLQHVIGTNLHSSDFILT